MAFADKRNKVNFQKTKTYFIKKRNKPLVLVFDDKAREDFLTGFRKRKLQRKKKAQEELEVELKNERKRIRLEAKNALKKLVARPDDPVIGEVYDDGQVVDMGSHQVHVTELDPQRLAKENNWIGANQIKYGVEDVKQEIKEESDEDGDVAVPGMETKKVQNKNKTGKGGEKTDLRTTKDVKRFVKKVATKKVQTSKAFQKKNEFEKIKNKRKKAKDERKQDQSQKKKRRRRRNRNRNAES